MLQVGGFRHAPGDALGQQLGDTWGLRVDPGLQIGEFGISIPLESAATSSPYPERDTDTLGTFGVGLALRGRLRQGSRLGIYAGAGYMRRWLFGGQPVVRRCSQVGGCDGGYWTESPRYTMSGPMAELVWTWTWSVRPSTRLGLAFTTRVERPRVELPGEGTVTGTAISTALTVWLGRGGR
jgi:hypothetical protein